MREQIIIKNYSPFPFLEIENMYNENELILIWQELDFLTHPIKLHPPEETGTAKNKDGIILKNNVGLFLDKIYAERKISNILFVNRKLFTPEITDSFSDLSFGYQEIKHTNEDRTLISYYENNSYYKPHIDNAIYTAITWFFNEPKCFTGGDFYFSDYDHKIKIKDNMTIIFPSFVKHSVDDVSMNQNLPIGNGRYSMSQFIYHCV
jgi:hypothetical protein